MVKHAIDIGALGAAKHMLVHGLCRCPDDLGKIAAGSPSPFGQGLEHHVQPGPVELNWSTAIMPVSAEDGTDICKRTAVFQLNADQAARAMEWQDVVLDSEAPVHFVDGGMNFTVWVERDEEAVA